MPEVRLETSVPDEEQKARQIWRQKRVPVIYRPDYQTKLFVKFPYEKGNREWLRDRHRIHPEWNKGYQCWEVARSWFEDVAQRLLRKFGRVYIIQSFRSQERCAPACWNAVGLNCTCSCMGEKHGAGEPQGRWYALSEACAVRWGDRRLGCRLITLPTPSTAKL